MNIASRLTKYGALKAQVDPKELPTWMLDRAQAARWDMPDPGSYEAQAALYTRLSWVYSAVTIVGQACALQALNVRKLFREKSKDIDNHPFELLLHKPNPLQSRYEFLRDTVSYSAINGNTYWWLNRDSEGAQPSEIWLLPSWRVQPKPDGKQYLEGYEFDADTGLTIMLPPWQVVHFKTFNPLSEFIGLSPEEPIAVAASSDLASQKWSAQLYGKNNARLPGILAFRDQIPNEIAWTRMQEDVRNAAETRNIIMLRGVGDRVDWIQAAASQADMQQIEQRQMTKEECYSVLAPGLASMLAINATEANSKAGKQTFLEMAIWPRLVEIAQKISLDILPAYGKGLVAEFDDPRQVDRALELAEMDAYAKSHTVDEIRAEYYDDEPLGDDRGEMLPVQIGQSTKTGGEEPAGPIPPQLQPFTGGNDGQVQTETQQGQGQQEEVSQPAMPPGTMDQDNGAAMRADLSAWRRKSLHALKAGRGAAVLFESDAIPPDMHADVWARLSACKSAADVRDVFESAMIGGGDDTQLAALAAKVDQLTAYIERNAWTGYP